MIESASNMRLLVIEDDRDSADYLVKAFREVGHVADQAFDGEEGLSLAANGDYDVLIVDRMLPKLDGLSLIGGDARQRQSIRRCSSCPRSARSMTASRDCAPAATTILPSLMPSPNCWRASRCCHGASVGAAEETVYRVGDLELDRLSHKVTRGEGEISLQPREFRLLEYLMKHAGQVVTRTMLLENVWDYHFDPQTNVIDVHISRLRAKIDKGFDRAAAAYDPRRRIHDP